MPINVGTVEAVLAARDQMSPALVAAAEKVAELRRQFAGLEEGTSAFKALELQLTTAVGQFQALASAQQAQAQAAQASTAANASAGQAIAGAGAAAATAATGMGAVAAQAPAAAAGVAAIGQAASAAAAPVGQLDALATRMIERMIILYAVRGTFQFVEGLFEAADALVRLNDQTGLTISKLQEVQHTADVVGVPFTKAASAIDTMDKNLAKMTSSSLTGLQSLGLSFEQLFALSPDERFDTIVAAIAKIPDQLQRTQAEIAIFGTDAIDPLIRRFAELGGATTKMSDDSVHALSNTLTMYRTFFDEVSTGAGIVVDKLQEMVALTLGPLFGGRNWGDVASDFFRNSPYQGISPDMSIEDANAAASINARSRDVNLPSSGKPVGGPVRGWDYLEQLRSQKDILNSLNGEQWTQLEQMRELDALNVETAAHMDISVQQLAAYKDMVKDWNKEASTAAAQRKRELAEEARETANYLGAIQNLYQDAGETMRSTLAKMDPVTVDYIESQVRAGKMLHDLGIEFGLTDTQMRVLTMDMQEQDKQAKSLAKSHEDLMKEVAKVEDVSAAGAHFQSALRAIPGDVPQRIFTEDVRALDEIEKLEQSYNVAIQQEYSTTTNFKIAEVERWVTVEKNKYKDAEEFIRTEFYDRIEAVARERINVIMHASDPLWIAWKGLNEDMRKEWADTWDKALEGTGSFTDALLAPFNDIEHGFKKMLAGMIADWEQQLLAPMLNQWKSAISGMFGMPMPGGTTTSGGSSLPPYAMSMFGAGRTSTSGGSQPAEFQGPIEGSTFSPYVLIPTDVGGGGGYGGSAGSSGSSRFSNPFNTNLKSSIAGGLLGGAGLGLSAQAGGLDAAGMPMSFAETMNSGMQWTNPTTYMMAAGTMGISVGVQAAISALKYLFRDRTMEDIARDAGDRFGIEFSKSTMEAIQKTHASGYNERASEAINLSSIISDQTAGGTQKLTPAQLGVDEKELRDVFSELQLGWFNVQGQVGATAAATKILDENFQKMVDAATDGLGRVDDQMKEIVALDEKFGTDSQAIAAWRTGQAANLASGVSSVVSALPLDVWDKIGSAAKSAEDALSSAATTISDADRAVLQTHVDTAHAAQATEAGRNRQELGDIGTQIVGSYATSVATGKSPAEALAEQSDSLTKLEKAYKDLGIEVDDVALKQLMMQNDVRQGNVALSDGIDGLTKELVAFSNLNLENSDLMTSQEHTAYSMYVRLQDVVNRAGGSTKDALLPMQQYLHAAEDEAKKLGVTLDANTQMLIDQSKELGIWKEEGATAADPLLKGLRDLVQEVHNLIRELQGLPPEIPTTVVTVPPGGPGPSPTPTDSGDTQVPDNAVGFASGIDSVPARLAPGERVVSTDQNRDLTALLRRLSVSPSNAAAGSRTVVLQEGLQLSFSIQADDASDLEAKIEKKHMPLIVGILEDRRRGYQSRVRRALELPA